MSYQYLSATTFLILFAAQTYSAEKPNVVYLLADDLGWGDLSVNGGSIPTPTIDKLFNEGIRLNNFMGWCVCSPTRAMLLTGRHPYRVGTGPETGGELAKGELTIAKAFKTNGYRTGIFGKWHNGNDPATPEFCNAYEEAFKDRPNRAYKGGGLGVNEHGFDEAWVYYGGGPDHFTRRISGGKGPVSWWYNREYRPQDNGYTDDLVTQHAIEFIRDNKNQPFFCYVPFNNVHAPMQVKESDLAKVDPKVTDRDKRVYAAMTVALDKYIAEILAELEKHGLRDNTIVVFTSDNGAAKGGCNLPFRGGKHSVFEGGTHLPTVIHWPKGRVQKGHWDGLCGALDMFPTLIDMAGLKMPETLPQDGKNIWPALRDDKPSPVESYYWSWHNEDAIRTANWRMHRFTDHIELYDIIKDIGETTNVADKNPEVVDALKKKMNGWVESMGVALSHLPPTIPNANPAPEGDVLEISITVTDKAKPRDTHLVQFARWDGHVYATDHVEYDVAVAPGSLLKGFYYTPFKGNNNQVTPFFKRSEGIDQFGRDQVSGPEPKGGAGVWEHRVIGLASYGPGIAPGHGIMFKGINKPGTYRIYLDNLRIRHANGKTTSIWSGEKDTKTVKVEATDLFKDVKVRIVNVKNLEKR